MSLKQFRLGSLKDKIEKELTNEEIKQETEKIKKTTKVEKSKKTKK